MTDSMYPWVLHAWNQEQSWSVSPLLVGYMGQCSLYVYYDIGFFKNQMAN